MGSAWTGDWESRINNFVRREGFDSLWDYVAANPTASYVQLAKKMGDVAPIQLERAIVSHCIDAHLMGEYLRDLVVRGVHEYLPKGWGSENDFAHVRAITGFSGLPEPYRELGRLLASSIKSAPPTAGWMPQTRDDRTLIAAYENAVHSLPIEKREMVMAGGFIRPPGSVYVAALEPIWKSVSIYDGPEVFLEQFSVVGTKLGNLLAAHWCQSEVCNGGFHQFFHNSTGVLAPEAMAGFIAIGMPDCGGVVAEAIGHFGDDYPRDQDIRRQLLRTSPGEPREQWDPFTDLEPHFYKKLRNENGGFAVAADNYARKLGPPGHL